VSLGSYPTYRQSNDDDKLYSLNRSKAGKAAVYIHSVDMLHPSIYIVGAQIGRSSCHCVFDFPCPDFVKRSVAISP
jgi:hypothetical protein